MQLSMLVDESASLADFADRLRERGIFLENGWHYSCTRDGNDSATNESIVNNGKVRLRLTMILNGQLVQMGTAIMVSFLAFNSSYVS
jgi:hypothetical protein